MNTNTTTATTAQTDDPEQAPLREQAPLQFESGPWYRIWSWTDPAQRGADQQPTIQLEADLAAQETHSHGN